MEGLLINLQTGGSVFIPEKDFTWTAVRSSGSGGQNVNKVASKVELRFHVDSCVALPKEIKERLQKIAATYMDAQGSIRVTSQKTRDQKRNLEDARQKISRLVEKAFLQPKPRIPTKPSRAVIEGRLQKKKRLSAKKQIRKTKEFLSED